MSRIQKAYENKFRAILGSVNARKFDKAVQWLQQRAQRLAADSRIPLVAATTEIYERARQRLEPWRQRHCHVSRQSRGASLCGLPGRPANPPETVLGPPRFLCDAGLGGLARWLRAAGYEARWMGDSVSDDVLLREAQHWPCILLTTDSPLMERRLLRDGHIPSLWLSPAQTTDEQLQAVLAELNLPLRESRCMKCGGSLARASKEAYRDRIPPKTYEWLDTFFVCEQCGQLFWHGTHWQKIQKELAEIKS